MNLVELKQQRSALEAKHQDLKDEQLRVEGEHRAIHTLITRMEEEGQPVSVKVAEPTVAAETEPVAEAVDGEAA